MKHRRLVIVASVITLGLPVLTSIPISVNAAEKQSEIQVSDSNIDLEDISSYIDESGNVYINGNKEAKIQEIEAPESEKVIPSIGLRNVTVWSLFNRKYYKLSNIRTAQGLAISVMGLIPFGNVTGTVLGVAGIYQTLRSMNQDEVYVKLEQFHNRSYTRVKNIIYYYSDSNYTNKIDQVEHIQRL